MFLEQGIKPENKFWKYLLGSLLIFVASFVGQIPLSAVVLFETFFNKKPYPKNDEILMKMFEPNLTLFLIMISFVFALTGVYYVVTKLHNQSFLSVTTSRKNRCKTYFVFFFIMGRGFNTEFFVCLF